MDGKVSGLDGKFDSIAAMIGESIAPKVEASEKEDKGAVANLKGEGDDPILHC